MTALPSIRLLEALSALEELRQERAQNGPDDVRFQTIHDTLVYLLHAMTGHAHGPDGN